MIPSSRDHVLNSIRSALGPQRPLTDANTAAGWTRPAFGGNNVERFITKAEASLCTVERVATLNDLGPALEALLATRGCPRDISIAPALRHVAWPSRWTVHFGPGRIVEAVSISQANAGIAETGSLVICSEPGQPASLNFLPDLHIAVLRTSDVVHHLEDIWPKVRALPVWPRAVNIISAPSRTADVAQIVVRPAHGPKALHVVLIEDAA